MVTGGNATARVAVAPGGARRWRFAARALAAPPRVAACAAGGPRRATIAGPSATFTGASPSRAALGPDRRHPHRCGPAFDGVDERDRARGTEKEEPPNVTVDSFETRR